jgi:hypothetical protein
VRLAPWLGSSARHESSAGTTRIPDGPTKIAAASRVWGLIDHHDLDVVAAVKKIAAASRGKRPRFFDLNVQGSRS